LALSSAFHSLTRLQDATMDDAVMQELMGAPQESLHRFAAF
jgi:hypothetical protein